MVSFRDSSGGKKLTRNGPGGVLGPLRKGAREATDQVKQTAAEVTRVITDTIQDEASRLFHGQRGRVAKRVERLGRVARQAAHALHAVKMDAVADYADGAAGRVEELADYISEKDLTELLQDAQEAARAHPAVAMGGLFVAGFAIARFLKASASRDEGEGDENDDEDDERGGRRQPRQRRNRDR